MFLALVLALSSAAATPAAGFIPGTSDPAAGVTYVQVADGIAAVALRDGALRWRSREAKDVLGVSGGRVLAQASDAQGPRLLVIDPKGRIVLRSAHAHFPGTAVSFALRRDEGSHLLLAWNASTPIWSGVPHPPGPFYWGTARLDLGTGALQVTQTGVSGSGEPLPPTGWLYPPEPRAPAIPPPFDGRSVMAAPARMKDGTIVMLRQVGDAILLYRWKEGSAGPGRPRTIAHQRPGHRTVLATAGGTDILLWDCVVPAHTDCRYELFHPDGALRGISPSPRLYSVGDAALASSPDPRNPKKFRLQRVDRTGRILWTRELEAVPPAAPPPP